MHAFPPIVDDFSFGAPSLLLLFFLAATIYLSWRINGENWCSFLWSFVASVFALWAMRESNRTGSTTFAVPWWNVALESAIAFVATIAVARNILTPPKVRWLSSTLSIFAGILLVLLLAIVNMPMHGRGHDVASARRRCRNNLKQIALAMHNYNDTHDRFPQAKAGAPPTSWRVHLLPFVGEEDIYEQYDLQSVWDSGQNKPLLWKELSIYDCPERRRSTNTNGQFLTAYVVPQGAGTMFGPDRATRIADIADGTTNTLMIAEACGTQIVWAEPRDADITNVSISVNASGHQPNRSNSLLSSYHMGGAMMAFADGSVRYVNSETSADVLRSFLTIAGNDNNKLDW